MAIRPVRYIWAGALVTLLSLAMLGATVTLLAGLDIGLASMLVGLLVVGWHHLRCMQQLALWTRQPVGTPVPRVRGVWGFLFADLDRRAKLAYDSRERLSAALERFREASQAMPDGVLYLSEHETIEWINRKAEEHFGLDHATDLGVPVTNLVRQPEFCRYLAAGHYAEPLVLVSARRKGLTLLVQVIPFGDDQKMVVSRDITQIEKLETMRRDFVANVSHELRTPLTVVSGFLETLMDGWEDFPREDIERFIKLAHDQSTRMQRLIEDLLTLSALETGAPAPVEERVDVAGLLREVHQQAELLSAGKHEVTLEIDGGGVLLGSQKELHSAFANLASNAVRYTPPGGKIRLQWTCDAHGAEFAVEDNGIGIAPEHLPRLTERFYRVDLGRSRETGGTGLGLAIVKHILSRHQAELHIDSRLGQGSRFSVRFPKARLASE
ncbi:phosphate regulon sensor histidine kinase PhoR [Pseudothauera hydrothermalis]|jgi:two-component system phosphate regulon sensor histidine kinase PhoR|uniref:phosphate regulon sensor histidine kinase PhoR n=1 Tax=Pseudothauera hydrothermalis TaxID=2184083 RepID=UPI000C7CA021|nr:phosphate regulon sensor histidine kinase PhoR [Pseudothauera hydrothermalis]AUM01109.1 phosphate regulon sensor histidine kinase PhoR [Rhodocyclaceae bacterium]